MAKVVTPVVCTVVIIGKPKESTFNPGQVYYPVLFADQAYPEGHEDAKIWKNLSADEVIQIQKGDIVQLVPIGMDKNGREKHQIVVLTPLPSVNEQAPMIIINAPSSLFQGSGAMSRNERSRLKFLKMPSSCVFVWKWHERS